MKNILYTLIVFSLLLSFADDASAKRKKKGNEKDKTETKKKATPYEKLFEGKEKTTVNGLMKVHYMDGKVLVEFPLALLDKDMVLTSSIKDISDNGEGVVGQFAGRLLPLRFTKMDSMLQARVIFTKRMMYDGEEAGLIDALNRSNIGGVFKSFKIKAYAPDSTAVVADMTGLFMESSFYTNPFATYAGNSMFGFVERKHELEKDKSALKNVQAYDNNIVVSGLYCYLVNHYVFGMLMYQNIPVTTTIDKILMLLPENEMRPRVADSRIGVKPVTQSIWNGQGRLERDYYVRRWRIEPEDEIKYRNGEMVNVKKPIVFYLDTIFPQSWKKYIKEGVEDWNAAFEKIGFKNVVQVREFPKNDPSFDANNINNSVIRYAPSWMSTPQTSMHIDTRSGEILNASIYVFNNLISNLYFTRVAHTMAVDPDVRKYALSDEAMGEMIKSYLTRLSGDCLGLLANPAASYAYPVDSLRSASFTRKYGLTSSIMDGIVYNYIAQPEDVQKGVLLTPKGIGEYDYYAIQWLYKPISEAKTPREEMTVLNQWIQEKQGNPAYRFAYQQPNIGNDPTALMKDLGNDHIQAMKYLLKNVKLGLKNYYTWYAENDKTMDYRRRMHDELVDMFNLGVNNVASYIGSMYINEVYSGDKLPSYEFVPKAKQKEAMNYLISLAKDVSWVDDLERQQEFELRNLVADQVKLGIFGTLLSRVHVIALSADKGGEYTPREYIDDMYKVIWDGTIKGRNLAKTEIELQQAFLGSIMATSSVNTSPASIGGAKADGFRDTRAPWRLSAPQPVTLKDEVRATTDTRAYAPVQSLHASNYSAAALYYDMLLKTRNLIQSAMANSSGETKQHYEYMLFKIKNVLEKK